MEEAGYEFQKKRQMILEKAHFQAQLALQQHEWDMSLKVKVAADLGMKAVYPPIAILSVI